MAVSRIVSSARRLFRRYQMFFFVAFLLVTVQLYLGYSFYNINQEELRKLEEAWIKRINERDSEHGIHSRFDKVKRDLRPDGDTGEVQQDVDSVQDMGGAGHPGGANHDFSLNGDKHPQSPESHRYFLGNSVEKSPHQVNGDSRHRTVNSSKFSLDVLLQNTQKKSALFLGDNVPDRTNNRALPDNQKNQLRAPPPMNWAISHTYKPKCSITEKSDKEAYSAIHRAETDSCKQEISDVVCLEREGKFFRKEIISTSCPLRSMKKGHYKGCYRDDLKKRILPQLTKSYPADNSVSKCINMCLSSGFEYSGVEWGLECWCAEKFNEQKALPLPEEECNTPCPGNPTKACGGYNAMNIYHTGAGARNYANPPLVDPSELSPDVRRARIAFILTLNGRALRQVKRLIKALYHEDHYFLIHVDSRQEYLYRELTKATASYPNIRIAPDRFATIWGGANLYTMLLKCMEYLFTLTDWKWDFFVNLSESDYPVRPIDQLVAFLSSYKDKNFLKSHGKDTPRTLDSLSDMLTVNRDKNFVTGISKMTHRFIQKQGLERTFVQCDNHMWRIGKRQLPLGIRIDGGSDWVALNREYCHYLVTSDDDLLKALKHYWNYTLLPGESFWHTVLQNTQFCTTFANNNLHMVNWNRRKGCKCQYKAIVDWCGCSPNDFLAGDMAKFMNLHEKKKIVFFARKFEAIVSQEIINQLDAFLYGSYPEGTVGLSSYWENRYTHEDLTSSLPDSHMTFYQTFARGALKHVTQTTQMDVCSLELQDILEVHVYQQVDVFQGLLVKFRAAKPTTNKTYVLETFVRYKEMFTILSKAGPMALLKGMAVGTKFDPKEEFFRNHGNLMGPHDSLTLALHWRAGKAFKVIITVIDPAQVVAVSFEVKVEDEEHDHAKTFELALDTPLRPGIWTVKLQYLWNVAAVSHFLITPYSYYGGRQVRDAEAVLLHKGPPGGTYAKESEYARNSDLLDLRDTEFALDTAVKNAQNTGSHLLQWIDDLTSKFWTVDDVCVTSRYSPCKKLAVCEKTSWSTMSPDPKSELGQVHAGTGRLR